MNHIKVLVVLQHQTCGLITVNPTDMTAGEHSIRKLNKIYSEFFNLPYIFESIPHPFYSFRGLKNLMRIIFAVESRILDKL
jgi:hypothetical protein